MISFGNTIRGSANLSTSPLKYPIPLFSWHSESGDEPDLAIISLIVSGFASGLIVFK